MTLTFRQTFDVCARASAHDQRLARANEAVVRAWYDHLAKYGIELQQALDAVDSYYDTPRERVIQIGDITRIARDVRNRQRDSQQTHAIASEHPALASSQPTHPGGLDAHGQPIPAAYEADHAIAVACPDCNASPRSYCANGQRALRIPHLSRVLFARKATQGASQ